MLHCIFLSRKLLIRYAEIMKIAWKVLISITNAKTDTNSPSKCEFKLDIFRLLTVLFSVYFVLGGWGVNPQLIY